MAKLLKIKAESKAEIEIFSALLQDALFRIGSMTFQKKGHRFAFVANRFCWEDEVLKGKKPKHKLHKRTRSALRFEGVLRARIKNIPLDRQDILLSLLSIDVTAKKKDFVITLIFSGGGVIELEAELLEAYLEDLTGPWATKNFPDHAVT